MSKVVHSLSRDARARRERDARRDLAQFLESLDPRLRRHVTSEATREDLMAWVYRSAERREQEDRAVIEYRRLLGSVPGALAQHRAKQSRRFEHGLRALDKMVNSGHVPSEGEDVLIAQQVSLARERLMRGVAIRRCMKNTQGYVSDDGEIRGELRATGYSVEECQAILAARSVGGAAHRLIAMRTGKAHATIKCRKTAHVGRLSVA